MKFLKSVFICFVYSLLFYDSSSLQAFSSLDSQSSSSTKQKALPPGVFSDSVGYERLNSLAVACGADKGSQYHNYTKVYAQYFDKIKDKTFNFLEIGVHKGCSVKLWEKYFSKANLYFIDITWDALEYTPTRAKLFLADQSDPQKLKNVVSQIPGGLDIIIDDGGHTMEQQQVSFKTLFPYVNSGGLYIIEDLHTSYWSSYGGGGRDSTVEFLKCLIDDVNFVGARTEKANHDGDLSALQIELNIYREQIYSICFYDSLCFIIKR